MTRPSFRTASRRALPLAAAIAVALSALGAAGCASSGSPTVAEQREILADRRADTRTAMAEASAPPSSLGSATTDAAGTMLDWFGSAVGTALDLVTLQTWGLW